MWTVGAFESPGEEYEYPELGCEVLNDQEEGEEVVCWTSIPLSGEPGSGLSTADSGTSEL